MEDRDLNARILGLVDPWQVRDVQFDLAAEEMRVTVAPKSNATLASPECGKACTGYDTRKRSWRHLDTCQFKTILVADVPRVRRVAVRATRTGLGVAKRNRKVGASWTTTARAGETARVRAGRQHARPGQLAPLPIKENQPSPLGSILTECRCRAQLNNPVPPSLLHPPKMDFPG